ncbi:MAG: hypothetical protein IKE43_04345 [Coriobacteriales bacterium]|nr:hypothetical protein [Coriobacteriales bacterium]
MEENKQAATSSAASKTPSKQPSFSWKSLCTAVSAWADAHNMSASVITGIGVAAALLGILAFNVFSGLGSTADFIYNQF